MKRKGAPPLTGRAISSPLGKRGPVVFLSQLGGGCGAHRSPLEKWFVQQQEGTVPATRMGTVLCTATPCRHPFSRVLPSHQLHLQSITWMLLHPRVQAKSRGVCLSSAMDQVISTQHLSLAQFGPKLEHLSQAEPSNRGYGIWE